MLADAYIHGLGEIEARVGILMDNEWTPLGTAERIARESESPGNSNYARKLVPLQSIRELDEEWHGDDAP